MLTRRRFLATATATTALGAVSACGNGTDQEVADETTLLLRTWSESAAEAYRQVLEGFSTTGGFSVAVDYQDWSGYWESLPLEVSSGKAPDVAWMNTAQIAQFRDRDQLLDVSAIVGDASAQWEEVTTSLYRHDGVLWAVPQVWQTSMLAVNRTMMDASGMDPATLAFAPSGEGDTLRESARLLTADAEGLHPGDDGFNREQRTQFGFNATLDRQAILGPFISACGGRWQDDDGVFQMGSSDAGAALRYLVDLAAERGVSPEGADTLAQPGLARTLFVEGRLGLFQTGTYDLRQLADTVADDVVWEIYPVIPGPRGRFPLVHAIGAVGIKPADDEDRQAAIAELLQHLGGVDVQRALLETGLGIPAHRELRAAWIDLWAKEEIDVAPAVEAPDGYAAPEHGERSGEGTAAAMNVLAEAWAGTADPADAAIRAQDEANASRGADG